MKIKFKTLFKFRYFFFTLTILLVTLLKQLKYGEIYNSVFDYFKDDTLSKIVDITVDVISIYFSTIGGIYMMRWWYHERKAENFAFIEVTVPRSDSKKDYEQRQEKDFKEKVGVMVQFYRALTELSEMNLWNTIRSFVWEFDKISLEMWMENRELKFFVVCDEYYKSIIEKQVTSFFPTANIETVEEPELNLKGNIMNGYYLHTVNEFWFPIKTHKEMENDPLNDMSNVFSKLTENEKAVMQMVINPKSNDKWRDKAEKKASDYFAKKKSHDIPIISDIPLLGSILNFITAFILPDGSKNLTNAPGSSGGDSYVRMLQPKEELAKRMGTKASQVGFDVSIRVLASAKTSERVEKILNNLVVGTTIYRDTLSNWFQNRRIFPWDLINAPLIFHGFRRRLCMFYMGKTSILVPEELATIFHFPDAKYNPIPIIKWQKYKVLPAPVNLPKEGVLLGNNVFRGQKIPVHFARSDRSRHHYVLGKSGSGKSVLLANMARQDIVNGEGICIVDPHGDLVEDVLACIPKERAKDVIIFNPADTDRPMGLNLLEATTPEQKDRASLDAMNIFIKLFGNEIFGPRIQHYFRNGCLTLMDDEDEGATIIDVPRLFVDDNFQKYKVSKCKNTVVRQFWENEMANTGDREKQEMIPYFTSKFGPFITNTTMRNIIGQPKSAFNIRQVMDEGKILLVNLSKGKIGNVNAQLLGMIFVNKIAMAAMSRADIPESQRRDFYFYVDEFQNFATDTFAEILSEARKYHLALIMAHQYIAQLKSTQGYEKESKLKEAVFGNVGTMMSFKAGADDAEYLAKEYAPLLTDQEILGIANYKAYLKLNINNATTMPFSLETIYDESCRNENVAEIIRKYSRMKYGRKRVFVDQEIEARLGIIE